MVTSDFVCLYPNDHNIESLEVHRRRLSQRNSLKCLLRTYCERKILLLELTFLT